MSKSMSKYKKSWILLHEKVIERQLVLSQMLVEAGYVVERQYRVKEKGSSVVKSYVVYGKRGDCDAG